MYKTVTFYGDIQDDLTPNLGINIFHVEYRESEETMQL